MWFRRPLKTFPFILDVVAALGYLAGVLWRVHYVLHAHDPRAHVYSDMELYVSLAQRLADPDYVATTIDLTHPPGLPWLISWIYRHDSSLAWLAWLQLGVALLVPPCIAALAAVVFGRTTALLSLIASSLYFPFIDYAGFFLTEIYMMLFIPLVILLYIMANRARSRAGRVTLGLISGAALSAATAFKLVALPAIFGFAVIYWLLYDDSREAPEQRPSEPRSLPRRTLPARALAFLRGRKTLVMLAFVVGMVPGLAALSVQCTLLNHRHFCLVSTKTSADFLLGHYGRIRTIRWEAPDGIVFQFGSPSNTQHNYTEDKVVPFSITDNARNSREAWKWIRDNPTEAFILSLEHVYDLLGGSFPWPGIWGENWRAVEFSQIVFMYLLFIPSIVLAVEAIRARGFRSFLRGPELLVLSPTFGVVAAVFVATGECRYRLPFDCAFIILAMEFYRRFRAKSAKFSTLTAGGAPPAAASANEPRIRSALSDQATR